jgi:hypothetical protein
MASVTEMILAFHDVSEEGNIINAMYKAAAIYGGDRKIVIRIMP